jgi:hypothetical protein
MICPRCERPANLLSFRCHTCWHKLFLTYLVIALIVLGAFTFVLTVDV